MFFSMSGLPFMFYNISKEVRIVYRIMSQHCYHHFAFYITESLDLSSKISTLRDVSVRAGSLASAASDRVRDLARQIENLKKHCTLKDLPLCDTINTNSLELKMKFDLVSLSFVLYRYRKYFIILFFTFFFPIG